MNQLICARYCFTITIQVTLVFQLNWLAHWSALAWNIYTWWTFTFLHGRQVECVCTGQECKERRRERGREWVRVCGFVCFGHTHTHMQWPAFVHAHNPRDVYYTWNFTNRHCVSDSNVVAQCPCPLPHHTIRLNACGLVLRFENHFMNRFNTSAFCLY